MAVDIQKKINFAFIVLGCSLPLIFASPGWTQTCTEAEIKANIAKFKDVDSVSNPLLQNVIRCNKEAIQPLISTLQNKQNNPGVRRNAANALREIGQGSPEVVKPLVGVLEDPQDDPEVRLNAVFALREIGQGSPEAVKALVGVLQDQQNNAEFRSIVALTLKEIGQRTPEVIKGLVRVLEDQQNDPEVRRSAAFALEEIGQGSPEDVKALVGLLENKQNDAWVRRNAANALRGIGEGSPDAVKALIRVVENKQNDAEFRRSAAFALKEIGQGSSEAIKTLVKVVEDSEDIAEVRRSAASALEEIGQGSPEDVKALVGLLENKQNDAWVRHIAIVALRGIGEGSLNPVQALVRVVQDKQDDLEVRMDTALAVREIGVGTPEDVKALLKVVQDKQDHVRVRGHAASAVGEISQGTLEVVKAFVGVLEDQQDDPGVRSSVVFALEGISQGTPEAVKALVKVLQEQQYNTMLGRATILTLEEISSNLVQEKDQLSIQKLEQFIQAFKPALEVQDLPEKTRNELKADINTLERTLEDKKESQLILQLLRKSGFAILFHALFWTGLIFLYPKSPQVQAIFFWNPKVRKIIGLWYVDLALTWVPFLRSKLFEPFRESLLSDADLESFNPQAYFPTSPVKHLGSRKIKPLNQVIPEIQGQIVLEGESGLGKSMFLRHLVQSSERIVIYIPAKKCDAGVMAAIQAKLHGYVKEDPNFLQSLIYSGAIDICIDGLNEVTPDTRAKITSFVESNFKGNIIMTTQPIDWTPPSTSTPKIYTLLPLIDKQIKQFLLSRTEFSTEATVTGEAYKQACQNYLTEIVKNKYYSKEERVAVRRMLSNPMELTVVSQMLSQGETPDVLNLQEQQYKMMAVKYKQMHLSEFPLSKFSEAVYQMRLKDEVAISPKEWLNELKCMERFKMVLSRQSVDIAGKAKQEWRFRHDKIQEFFIVQTFLGEPKDNRIVDHINDPRFRGVYFLLAAKMPIDAAQKLREELIQYAAQTKDHTVSDTFIQLLRSRQAS